MANTPARYKQADITKCLKAHRDAGLEITHTETKLDGTIVVYTSNSKLSDAASSSGHEIDQMIAGVK